MKKKFSLLALIGLAVISAWQWKQHQSGPGSALPVEDSVASQEQPAVPQLQSASGITSVKMDTSRWAQRQATRNDADDADSLARTFKEARDCLIYHGARRELNAILDDERLDDLSNETLATLENIDTTSSKYLSIARRTEAFCIGSDEEALAKVYTDAILKSALLGDPDAESCFVISSISPLEGATPESLEFLERRYLKYAPIFMQNALKRGDSYAAARALYQYVASPGWHPSRLDDIQKADPYLTWRAARLASLRALPEQRLRLENRLALLEEQNLLLPDEIKRADAWARATYEREFAGQPPINLDSHTPCYSSPDLAP